MDTAQITKARRKPPALCLRFPSRAQFHLVERAAGLEERSLQWYIMDRLMKAVHADLQMKLNLPDQGQEAARTAVTTA